MRSHLQYSIWASLMSMMAVAFGIVFLQLRFDSEHRGKHHWICDTDDQCVNHLFRELIKLQRIDVSAKSLPDFFEQLHISGSIENDLSLSAGDDFITIFSKIDLMTPLDQVVLMLGDEFGFEIIAETGRLKVVESNNAHANMVRVYDLPDVPSRQLERDICEVIDPRAWSKNGGAGSLMLQRNDLGTRCKLLVSASWRTHRKVERFINVLADEFGWKGQQVPMWLTDRNTSLPALPRAGSPSPAMGMGGGSCFVGGTGIANR